MKKIKILSPTSILVLITLFIIISGIAVSNIFLPYITATNKNDSYEKNTLDVVQEKVIYVVKEHDGKIAVFEKGENSPFKITDVYVSDLPKVDKKILAEGIEAENQKELSKILEDYCS